MGVNKTVPTSEKLAPSFKQESSNTLKPACSKLSNKLSRVAHACNLSNWEADTEDQEFKTRQGYIVNKFQASLGYTTKHIFSVTFYICYMILLLYHQLLYSSRYLKSNGCLESSFLDFQRNKYKHKCLPKAPLIRNDIFINVL